MVYYSSIFHFIICANHVKKTFRIATRKSPLALWQANHVADKLKQHWPTLDIQLVPLTTSGDRFLKNKLLAKGGKGLFVKELEEALLENRADAAVHSMKDVPSQLPNQLILSTICKRDSPFDVLISKNQLSLANLPPHATVGTSSLRRQAQLLSSRQDLQIHTLRGNINSRIDKLQQGQYDAIVLAEAALDRMQLQHLISERLMPPVMLPACGQGALGIECREEDHSTQALLAPLHDDETGWCVLAEREVNALLGGNCHVPLAIFCVIDAQKQLHLQTQVMSANGSIILTEKRHGPIEALHQLAQESVSALLAQGAEQLLSTT